MGNRLVVRAVAFLALLLVGSGSLLAAPAACQVTSPAKKNTLVELFTSDGCDSCPPANKWLSGVAKGADKSVIPVSMHVTYWNHLGWKDGYGNTYFDDRQDAYVRHALSKFSYTPELFLNAREYRGWRGEGAAEIAGAQKELAPVSIKLVSRQADARSFNVDATVAPAEGGAKGDLSAIRLYVLLYEDDLADKPNAGELKNVVLKHDHVVRDWKVIDVSEAVRSGKPVTSTFSLPPQSNPKKSGVVAFVQTTDLKSIHQVVDLPLCF